MGKRSLGREPELFPWEKHRHRSSAPPKAVPRCCSSASRKQAVNKRASKCSLRGKGLLGGGGERGDELPSRKNSPVRGIAPLGGFCTAYWPQVLLCGCSGA